MNVITRPYATPRHALGLRRRKKEQHRNFRRGAREEIRAGLEDYLEMSADDGLYFGAADEPYYETSDTNFIFFDEIGDWPYDDTFEVAFFPRYGEPMSYRIAVEVRDVLDAITKLKHHPSVDCGDLARRLEAQVLESSREAW